MEENKIVGISIQKNEWRMAELAFDGGQVTVRRTWAASSLTNEAGATCVAGVPATDVLSRRWTFPPVAEGELEPLVRNRLEADLPIPAEEVMWGYRKTKTFTAGNHNWLVLLQAVRNKRIDACLKVLATAGVKIRTLTTEAEGIGGFYRYGLKRRGEEREVLVLATAEEWQIAFLTNGLVGTVRRLRTGDAFLPQCVRLIEAEEPRVELKSILWCADTEAERYREPLSSAMGVEVSPVLCEMAEGDKIATFAPAIGLALLEQYEKNEIVRLAGETESAEPTGTKKYEKYLAHPLKWTAAAMAGVILVLAIQAGAIGWENHKMQRILDAAEANPSAMVKLEPKIQAAMRIKKYRLDTEGVLIDICRALPNEIVISGIQVSRENKVSIRGTTKDPKAIFTFVDTLRKSNRLSHINPENIEIDKGGFMVSAELVGVRKLSSPAMGGESWK